MAQPAIAAAMGVSLSTVNRAHMAYDDGGKLRATCATWDDAVRGPSRQEGGMTREKAVDLVMNAQRGVCRRAGC